LYWWAVNWAVVLRNRAHGSTNPGGRHPQASRISCSGDEKGFSLLQFVGHDAVMNRTILVTTTIVKRFIPGAPSSGQNRGGGQGQLRLDAKGFRSPRSLRSLRSRSGWQAESARQAAAVTTRDGPFDSVRTTKMSAHGRIANAINPARYKELSNVTTVNRTRGPAFDLNSAGSRPKPLLKCHIQVTAPFYAPLLHLRCQST
jgi:hypothetical protein